MGRLIVLEGIDGCGKSTVAQVLKNKIRDAEIVSFPTPDAKLRAAELENEPVMSSVLLYVGDMVKALQETVAPLVKQGKTVIFDRYWLSTVVYQGGRLKKYCKNMEESALMYASLITSVKGLLELAGQELCRFDDVHYFILTLPFRDALLRSLQRSLQQGVELDQYERAFDKEWEYRALFYANVDFTENETRISVLDKTPEQIAGEILENIDVA